MIKISNKIVEHIKERRQYDLETSQENKPFQKKQKAPQEHQQQAHLCKTN